jgi:NADH-quinone oxidoreductase subunit F
MTRVLTSNIEDGRGTALDLVAYERRGGYEALNKVFSGMGPDEVRELVKDANLRGRGGAGFPAGVKWGFVPRGEALEGKRVYLVCNCDEMEPGSFKDRYLLYGDPHQLLEGIIISAYAVGAGEAFVFVRCLYEEGARLFRQALAEAREKGYVGQRILGSGYSLDVHVHTSAGRYICGEETAQINAIEGRRANPRARPPFPPVEGLWSMPTVVNNVETLSCVPHIVLNGADWFRSLGRGADAGTKLYTVSGRVKRPGVYELPIGVTLNELIEEHCGGMREGYALKAVIPGGGSTPMLDRSDGDVAMDFESLAKIGSRLGTAGVIVIDDKTSVVAAVRNLEQFYAQESCGWCTPCREGIPYVVYLLSELLEGRGRVEYIDDLELLARQLGPNAFCALCDGAMGPLESSLRKFRHEYEALVPAGAADG